MPEGRRWARTGRTVEPDPAWVDADGRSATSGSSTSLLTVDCSSARRTARRTMTLRHGTETSAAGAVRRLRPDGPVLRGRRRRARPVPVVPGEARETPVTKGEAWSVDGT